MAQRRQTVLRGKTQTANFKRIQGRKKTGVGRDYYDYNLLAAVILLTCFGLVMLYSTSAYEATITFGSDMYYFTRQALISIASLVMVLIFSQFDYHIYAKFSTFIYGVAVFLLFITEFVGTTINGARRWIYIGSLSFQPAELAKLAVILFLPCMIIKIGSKMQGFKAPAMVLGFGGVAALFTYAFTDNLSTGIIIAGITVVLIFVAHPKTKPFVWMAAGGAGLVGALVWYLSKSAMNPSGSFRLRRIMVWLNPQEYASEGGYQVMQGLYAIGSGGLFGKGLGNSTQKLGALPEAQNDMIFSIVCEELGVFGAAMVILLFVFLLYRLFFIAQNAPDLLGSLIVTGIFVHISLQVILNIAVVINLIPTTGITLPFVSYGGTSIVFLMAEMTLALSVSKRIEFK
ncbi:MAG: putative peptidoglycan glycosyltransferase FtsW [Lachnospiraceae bacterium]|nr:putative peptidoglycan glycosyltransferase FtsW [Lachnospiraceae bacterium]